MMKKKIILVIAICVLFSNYLIVNASSSEVTLSLEKREDKIIVVTLSLPKIEDGIDALTGKIEYDKSKLELVDIKKASEEWQEPSYNKESGKFTLLISSETVKEPVETIKFTFKINEKVKGNTKITVSELTGATSKDEEVSLNECSIVINTSNEQNENNGNSENGNNTNTENNGNSGSGNNTNTENGGNSGSGNNTNTENGGNSESGNNTNTENGGNSESGNNTNTINGVNNNIDNMAQGKLPQTGESLVKYIIIAAIVFLIISTIILILNRKRK